MPSAAMSLKVKELTTLNEEQSISS